MRTPRSLLTLTPVLGALLLAPAASAQAGQPCPSTLNPPALSFETCQMVGGGTIASGGRVVSDPLGDTSLSCGAFDIFNQDTFDQHAARWYDESGDLTRRHIYDHYTFGQWSNPLTGAVVPYTMTTVENDELAIPGDFNSATSTYTGEAVFHAGTGTPVLFGQRPDSDQLRRQRPLRLLGAQRPQPVHLRERSGGVRPDLRRARRVEDSHVPDAQRRVNAAGPPQAHEPRARRPRFFAQTTPLATTQLWARGAT
jgi:hypothetical protein